MKDAHNMVNPEDDVNANSSKYASLTAGLLARKGEAVPAAAAFTAEAIAQHIPARRLAQEAERVLADRHPVPDSVIEESPGAQVVADHRDMIEQAFNQRAMDAEMAVSPDNTGEGRDQGAHKPEPLAGLDSRDMSLGSRRELELPGLGASVSAGPDIAKQEGNAVASNWDDDEGNWFENIVSNAISEAGSQVVERNGSEHNGKGASSAASEITGSATSDAQSPGTDSPSSTPVSPKASSGGCGDKAAKVRDAIKSGKTALAARSAMRLDPRRFIRLSLAAQKLDLNSQEVMVAALDTYLDALDEEVFSDCACMKKGLI